jgi:mevalonate kinase
MHAKIILIGEHAVVYQKKAIVCPVFDANVQVQLAPHDQYFIESDFYKGLLIDAPTSFESIKNLIEALITTFNVNPVKINIHNHIPVAAGMGASAAIAGAIVQAFFQYHQETLSEQTLVEWIQRSETIAHGNPSGIDMYGVLSNHALIFQRNIEVSPLTFQMDGYLLITFSNEHGSTKEAVTRVSQYVAHNKHVLEDMEISILKAIKAIQHKHIDILGHELNTYQNYLKQIGVSTPRIDAMVRDALSFGAVGAKLSGGGLGGCMIALFKNIAKLHQLQEHYKRQGYHQQFIIDLKRI